MTTTSSSVCLNRISMTAIIHLIPKLTLRDLVLDLFVGARTI